MVVEFWEASVEDEGLKRVCEERHGVVEDGGVDEVGAVREAKLCYRVRGTFEEVLD